MSENNLSCIDCAVKNCDKEDRSYPPFCLTTHMDHEILNEALSCYQDRKITQSCALPQKWNLSTTVNIPGRGNHGFCRKNRRKKDRHSTCVGLLAESRTLAQIFRSMDLKFTESAVSRSHPQNSSRN